MSNHPNSREQLGYTLSTPSNHQFIQAIAHILKQHQMGLISDDECADRCIEITVNHLESFAELYLASCIDE